MEIQRLTIIVEDQLVQVDGYPIHMPFNCEANVHAIQWQAGSGEIEYNDGTQNEPFTDLEPYRELIEEHQRQREEALKPYEQTREEIADSKKQWRNAEIQRIAERLDQYRNDQTFGTDTFPFEVGESTSKAASMLNSYRVALIEWPDDENFPDTDVPEPPFFLEQGAFWWV